MINIQGQMKGFSIELTKYGGNEKTNNLINSLNLTRMLQTLLHPDPLKWFTAWKVTSQRDIKAFGLGSWSICHYTLEFLCGQVGLLLLFWSSEKLTFVNAAYPRARAKRVSLEMWVGVGKNIIRLSSYIYYSSPNFKVREKFLK